MITVQFEEILTHTLTPPTYFEINDFVWPFHEVVMTYGTPKYKEINPTVFNIVTFPFLFGIMFGDIGHGGLLLLVSIYICLQGDCHDSQIIKSAFKIRYMLLMMGFFAFYCGLIYNDMLSLPLDIFETCY